MNRLRFGGILVLAMVLNSLNQGARAGYMDYYGSNPFDPDIPGSGGAVAGGTLRLSDNGTTVYGTFNKGNGNFDNNLVMYIDTGSGTFGATTTLYDHSDGWRSSVSGNNGSQRSTAVFASGFHADYALVIGVNPTKGGYLYQLVGGAGSTFPEPTLANFSCDYGDDINGPFRFHFDWTDLGMTSGAGNGFRFETAYVHSGGNSYFQSFEKISGTAGFGHTITFNTYDVYGVEPVPETTNAALAVFAGLIMTGGLVARARRSLSGRHLQSEV
jgi:hypothetical protein